MVAVVGARVVRARVVRVRVVVVLVVGVVVVDVRARSVVAVVGWSLAVIGVVLLWEESEGIRNVVSLVGEVVWLSGVASDVELVAMLCHAFDLVVVVIVLVTNLSLDDGAGHELGVSGRRVRVDDSNVRIVAAGR